MVPEWEYIREDKWEYIREYIIEFSKRVQYKKPHVSDITFEHKEALYEHEDDLVELRGEK